MTKAQKKIVIIWCVVAAALASLPLYEGLILAHLHFLRWVVFIIIMILIVVSQKDLPTRDERHVAFNQLIDEHPWIKIYLGVYTVIISLVALYIVSNQIDISDHMVIFLIGSMLGLVLPIIVIRQWEAWNEAGR